jgi:hypothetical protein
MADSAHEAAPACRSVGSLVRFATEFERWCSERGTGLRVDLTPDTEPFPTLLAVTATGAAFNVLAGRRELWWMLSATKPDGIFRVGYRLLGPLDAPGLAAATLGRLLTDSEVNDGDQSDGR